MILLIFLFFSGGISNIQSVSWIFQWLKYLSVVYWFYSGLYQSQLLSSVPSGVDLAGYEETLPPAWFSLLMILVIGSALYIVGMIAIRFTYTPKTKIT